MTTRTRSLEALLEAEAVSPKDQSPMEQAMHRSLTSSALSISSMENRTDPDAQATVTDFLDFTEYLPSDMVRSLTLIGKLDQTYSDASAQIDRLTTAWVDLPNIPAAERADPVQLRAQISEELHRSLNCRVYSHEEAMRMADNVNRHYKRAKTILSKLRTMLDNYPTAEEQKSPVAASKSPQAVRTPKPVARTDGQKARRPRMPRITVPGEVLAPYELDLEDYSDDSDATSTSEGSNGGMPPPRPRTPSRTTPSQPTRIRLVSKPPKTPKPPPSPPNPIVHTPHAPPPLPSPSAGPTPSTLNPPPDNAVIGSADAPWFQLTLYELAKLRKRMKKNAVWNPSDTMIARELKALGRGPDAYKAAKKSAEDEGKPFNHHPLPTVTVDKESGAHLLPEGAISADALEDELPVSNKGMRLNEAKKLKREAMAKQAAEEAEESTRKMTELARLFLAGPKSSASAADLSRMPKNIRSRGALKRKREAEELAARDAASASKPQTKRAKTETPVPPPQFHTSNSSQTQGETPIPPPQHTPSITATTVVPHSMTPVPIPLPHLNADSSGGAARLKASTSPPVLNTTAVVTTTTTTVPTKPPAETPILPPTVETRKSTTPILLPVREQPKRETRQDAARKIQQADPTPLQPADTAAAANTATPNSRVGSSSRSHTPRTTPAPEGQVGRRPSSRGKALSQDPPQSLAADRSRRASTTRITPGPEAKPPSKRAKRPVPGVVSTTNSGGNSAVGTRKVAPRKKARVSKKEKGQQSDVEVEEVDDEGNPIDPNEARYCLCNRVSFGIMINCDNVENCKGEWFHLECVNLTDIPARTTKWYCPDCRILLNIGEKGEVSARGVRM